jgi:four helix bundle protein
MGESDREPAQRFEDLWIWQRARVLVGCVYDDTDPHSAPHHDFAFRDQIRRAAISIMNNIAEGFERRGDKEFARFLAIAKGSCGEVRSMYHLAEDRSYLPPEVADRRRKLTGEIASGIHSLIKHLRA